MFASFNMRWWTIQLLMDKFNSKCKQMQAADSSCIDKAESGDTVFEAFTTVCVYYAVDKKLMWRRQPPQQPHPQIFDRRKHKFTQQQDFWQIKTQKAQRNSAAPFLFSPAVIQNNELLLKAFSTVPGEIVRGGWKLKGVRRYVSWDGWWEGLVKRQWHMNEGGDASPSEQFPFHTFIHRTSLETKRDCERKLKNNLNRPEICPPTYPTTKIHLTQYIFIEHTVGIHGSLSCLGHS